MTAGTANDNGEQSEQIKLLYSSLVHISRSIRNRYGRCDRFFITSNMISPGPANLVLALIRDYTYQQRIACSVGMPISMVHTKPIYQALPRYSTDIIQNRVRQRTANRELATHFTIPELKDLIYKTCLEQGVYIRDGKDYYSEEEEDGWFRITFTVDEHTLEVSKERLRKALKVVENLKPAGLKAV